MSPLLPLGARPAYGTEVPMARKLNLYLLTGVQAAAVHCERGAVHKNCHFGHQTERIRCEEACYARLTGEYREQHFGHTWDRRSRNFARPGRRGLGADKNNEESSRRKVGCGSRRTRERSVSAEVLDLP